jgi:hypothetical protein
MAHPFFSEVAIAGPYKASEASVRPDDPRGSKGLSWKTHAVGVPGCISLPASDTEMRSFLLTEVTAPEPLKTRLQLGANHWVRAWVNGRQVYDSTPGMEKAQPDQASVEVELQKGVNQILFQVTYKGDKEAIYARLLDPQRRLRYPEHE